MSAVTCLVGIVRLLAWMSIMIDLWTNTMNTSGSLQNGFHNQYFKLFVHRYILFGLKCLPIYILIRFGKSNRINKL